MSASVEALPPQFAMALDQKVEDNDRQLYRIVYFSKVHPDESDLNKVAIVRCTVHLFSLDANEAYALFSNNVPENYPVFILVSVQPVSPDVPEDSILEVTRGPRAL